MAAYETAFLERGVHVRRGVDTLLHRRSGGADRNFPCAVRHFETVVSLPIYPALNQSECARVAKAAAEVFSPHR
jgi:dTDP-4-amino-4,6-dideoxygalactose transaminase